MDSTVMRSKLSLLQTLLTHPPATISNGKLMKPSLSRNKSRTRSFVYEAKKDYLEKDRRFSSDIKARKISGTKILERK